MYRFVAILVVLSLPQFASAQSVSFGAGLSGAGHIGGSADSINNVVTGRVHWSGNGITIHDGSIETQFVLLLGTITRSNDPNLEGKEVRIELLPNGGLVFFTIHLEPDVPYSGTGRVTIR